MRFVFTALKTLVVVIGAMLLTAFTINATDNLGNFSDSALGGMVSAIFGEESRCPQGMTLIDDADGGFCIDIYEASPAEECFYDDPANEFESRSNLDTPDCVPVSQEEAIPWRNISQTQAVSACIKAGKRLPTNKEWHVASVGTPDKIGDTEPEACNIHGNWSPSSPGLTGSGEDCVSYYGAYDMIGNVWEWVSDTVRNGSYLDVDVPPTGYVQAVDESGVAIATDSSEQNEAYGNDRFWSDSSKVTGVFRGGYWGSRDEGGLYSVYAQLPPSFVGIGVGFRCVTD